jgi:toxin ParE1/3/4
VSAFLISRRAERDLHDLRAFTIDRWGKRAAVRYLRQLHETFQRIAEQPKRARPVPQRPALRYARCGRHVVYYEVQTQSVLIVRVLHERMLPDLHL